MNQVCINQNQTATAVQLWERLWELEDQKMHTKAKERKRWEVDYIDKKRNGYNCYWFSFQHMYFGVKSIDSDEMFII